MFLELNPCFQRACVFCMDLQPAADPYNVVPYVNKSLLLGLCKLGISHSHITDSYFQVAGSDQ